MVQLFIDGGGFMWPILFIFIIGFVFVGERLYHLVKGLQSDEAFANDVADTYQKSGLSAAQSLCANSVGPVSNLCANALDKASDGVDAAVHAAGRCYTCAWRSTDICERLAGMAAA